MSSKETIKYSLRNLKQKKSRSFLTILSIFIGITTIFIFLSFGMGLFEYVDGLITSSSANKIAITPKGIGVPGLDDTFALTKKDISVIKRTQGIEKAIGMYSKAAEVEFKGEKKFVFAIGYNPESKLITELFNIEIFKGRELKKRDTKKVILGYNYLFEDKIFSKKVNLNDKILVQGEFLKVIGFFSEVGNPQDDSNIYLVESSMENLYGNNLKGFNMAIGEVEDVSQMENTIQKIEKNLRSSRNVKKGNEDFFVKSFEDLLSDFVSVLNGILIFIIFIGFISLFVSAINTANTMITSVLERIKEIGIIKSIGATNFEIFSIFLFESSFLGFIAGILGVLTGWGITSLIGIFISNLGWGFLSPAYSPYLFFGLILFSTITGAISGVIPSRRASKINPVDALRYE